MSQFKEQEDWYKEFTERKDLVSEPDGRGGVSWNVVGQEFAIEQKVPQLIRGIKKTVELLRRIDGEKKYTQSFGRWVGAHEYHMCAVAAVSKETGNFKHDGKRWFIDNEAVINDLGISANIWVKMVIWNDIGMTYSEIADKLERNLQSGELLR